MCCESLMGSDFTFDPCIKVKQGSTIFKGPRTHLLLVLESSDVEVSNFLLSNIYFYQKICVTSSEHVSKHSSISSILPHELIF